MATHWLLEVSGPCECFSGPQQAWPESGSQASERISRTPSTSGTTRGWPPMCELVAVRQCRLKLLLHLVLSLARLTCRRIFGSLVAGLMAGIWGVTGWIGFAYYFAAHAVVSLGSR